MLTDNTTGDRASHCERNAALAVICLGVAIRLWVRVPTDFWEDEFIAATHAMQPFGRLLINIVRNDVHPPLFFLQLHVWSLLGQSDVWLKLNSVLWSLVALGSLWWTANRLYGSRTALLATAIFAILPSPAYMADQLRMYAMLATLIIWAFYFASITFGSGNRSRKNLVWLTILLIAICNTHAIGAIAVFSNGIYALSLILVRPRPERSFKPWLLIYGIAAVSAAPWIVTSIVHDANLSVWNGIPGFITALSATTLGQVAFQQPFLRAPGAAVWLGIVAFGLASRRSRAAALAFLLLPLLLATAAEFAHKPLFKWNVFSTMAAPFLALLLARGLEKSGSRTLPLLSAGCTLALLALCIDTRLTVRESEGYRALTDLIRANYKPGDIVYAPQPSVFGGLAWYLEGPRWGSPLEIAAKPSPQWRKVYDKLGPELVGILGLEPKTQFIRGKNVTLLVGNGSADQAKGASRVWLVVVSRADLAPGYPPADLNGLQPRWSRRDRLWTILYASSPHETVKTR
ncbi:MAG TPA: glycosyltransferase family 39 protein [Rhizomicrobium sp.]|nr:glycosyltransferase family 39 protein [Rhizomicrobium sp.]